jgi:hypothetical protein
VSVAIAFDPPACIAVCCAAPLRLPPASEFQPRYVAWIPNSKEYEGLRRIAEKWREGGTKGRERK